MGRLLYWSLAFFSLSLAARAATWPVDQPLVTLGEQPPGFGAVKLWNDRDLEGWTFYLNDPATDPKTGWSVTKGVLHLAGKPSGYLKTIQPYGNYRLHLEWRWPGGAPVSTKSGIFVHLHGADAIAPPGVEIQLKAGEAGELVGLNGDPPEAPLIRGNRRGNRPHTSSEKPLGEWNACDIFCRHQIVEVWVNSVLQSQTDGITFASDPPAAVFNGRAVPIHLRGAIALQAGGYPIDFRNIWLESMF